MPFDLARYWYRESLHPITFFLWPFSKLFGLCVAVRRSLYRLRILKTHHFATPVIVVGNITVGGTGKTPFVLWLVDFLRANGFKPGIVSRGVGGKKHVKPYRVKQHDSAEIVGDEAILLLQSGCPVVISVDRVAAVRDLLEHNQCNIVISDDGLQHYRLGRDIEIAIVDGVRRFGNRLLLPAGPLREPVARLNSVDFTVENGSKTDHGAYGMMLEPVEFVSLVDEKKSMPFEAFVQRQVHAVAGIGHPERFFLLLKNAGFNVIAHSFPDHHPYQPHELDFNDTLPILMTEKDAVKCRSFADERYWYLRITAKINNIFEQKLLEKIALLEVHHVVEEDFSKHSCRLSRDGKRDNICE
ncbi:tetraacyldisaccharide 4'-kinase [Aquicella lusitana]|mgnify:CR=1 FL=1|uniref:Tetraacyldisaccharide 4'-kinase n=1 Tax=Aquicella lusitana TaxID=254246 RepID=A0A370GZJ8_9COXI|nr:tetraacyldisaccharide 4'-kinase [Aquicella lusitana]RDI48737.1 lipid-A-disaccharide kinase [Aquicella lusitana]VVC73165.1 Tetraacyldisaccharide 4'-kinase [Aquicella lusitana]